MVVLREGKRKRVVVKIVKEVDYALGDLPLNFITTAIKVDGIRITDGIEFWIEFWDDLEGKATYACRTTRGIGCFVTPQHVVEVTDKHTRFLYYMNGPYIDEG